jgi:RNA polymerase sigma factor (sigma-70 family)
MAATAAPVTTAEVAALHDRLTRFVFANFHRKLTFEEARDAAAEALEAADRAVAAGKEITDLNAWLCTAAWRDAISMVRRLEGEGRRKRLRPVDVSEQGEWLLDERDVEGEILTSHGRRTEQAALALVWTRLKPDEQRALYLRYFDELPVDDVLQLLGCSRHHYENLTKRGIRKLREALIAGAADDACRDCRTAIVESKLLELDAAEVARRDAHLSSCLPCRAFQRRQRGLIAVLPLPAIGVLDRISARMHGLVNSGADVSQPGEAAAGSAALAAAGTSAGAGAVGVTGAAGGLVAVGGTAKTLAVVCSAGAIAASVCASAGPLQDRTQRDHRADRPEESTPVATRRDPSPVVAAVTPVRTPATASTESEPTASKPSPSRRERRVAADARREAARKASSPFLPESAAPPPQQSDRPPAQQPATTTFSSGATPSTSRGAAPSPAATRTAFSEEFTP